MSEFIFNVNKLYFAYLSLNWIFKYLSEKNVYTLQQQFKMQWTNKKDIEIYLYI